MEELKYSTENATINRAMFFGDFNNPIVFVEDDYKEYVYEKILNKMFPNIEFFVNPCGGKDKVEEAYSCFGEIYDKCKCIYLCDGDFDILINRNRINNSNFIYLKKYELENYFVDKNSLLELYLGRAHGRRNDAIKLIDYDNWYKAVINSWFELMILYIVVQRNKTLEMNSTGISPDKFLNKQVAVLDLKKVQEYRNELEEKLKKINKDLNEEVKEVKLIIKSKEITKDSIVKGKYIIATAKSYIYYLVTMKKKTPVLLNDEVLSVLLQTFDINSLDYVKQRIEVILSA